MSDSSISAWVTGYPSGNTANIHVHYWFWFDWGGWNLTGGASFGVGCDGQWVSGNFTFDLDWGEDYDFNWDYTVSRGNSARNVGVGGWVDTDGCNPGSFSSSGSVAIAARVSHTVSYNANGGSGAPGNQTKWYGDILTLSSTKPTRANYEFLGWSTSSSSSTINYNPGSQYGTDADLTLYAVWKLSYVAPTVSISSCHRATSAGALSDDDVYGRIVATGIASRSFGDISKTNSIYSIRLVIKCDSSTVFDNTWTSNSTTAVLYKNSASMIQITPSFTNTLGSDQSVIAVFQVSNSSIAIDKQYDVTVYVQDTYGHTNSIDISTKSTTSYISKAFFTMDFKNGGKGIGIGCPATSNFLEVAMNSLFSANNTTIRGDTKAFQVKYSVGTLPVTGVITKWAMFSWNSSSGGYDLAAGSEAMGLTYAGNAGVWYVNFASAMPTTSYFVLGSAESTVGQGVEVMGTYNQTATTVLVDWGVYGYGGINPTYWNIAIISGSS